MDGVVGVDGVVVVAGVVGAVLAVGSVGVDHSIWLKFVNVTWRRWRSKS